MYIMKGNDVIMINTSISVQKKSFQTSVSLSKFLLGSFKGKQKKKKLTLWSGGLKFGALELASP